MKYLKKIFGIKAVRYLLSSCVSFAVDYVIFLALDAVLAGLSLFSMELAAIISFAVSSQINFWINRTWVFGSEGAILPEIGGYYSLAGVSFLIKTFVLLELFVRLFRIPKPISKLLAETLMFVINYTVQKKLIFRKGKK